MDDVNGISLEAGRELWALPLSPLEEIEEDEVELRTGTSRERDLLSSSKESLVCGWVSGPVILGVVFSESGNP